MATDRIRMILYTVAVSILPQILFGQNCYEVRRTEGLELMNSGRHHEAINIFFAALVECEDKPIDDDLIDLIKEAQLRQVKLLEHSVQEQKAAYERAEQAAKEAVAAREAESVAKEKAQQNALIAKQRGVSAESRRLALLADLNRQEGNKRDALLLSWLALQAPGNDTSKFIYRSFANAVRDSFKITLLKEETTDLEKILPVQGTDLFVIKSSDGSLKLFNPSQELDIITEADAMGIAATQKASLWTSWTYGSEDITIRDPENGRTIRVGGHSEPIRYAVFSPDKNSLVTCSRDNTAKLWNADGILIATLSGHSGNIYHADYSEDGSLIFTRGTDGRIILWNSDGSLIAHLDNNSGAFYFEGGFIDQSNMFAALSAAGHVDLWQTNGQFIKSISSDGPIKEYKVFENANQIAVLDVQGLLSVIPLSVSTKRSIIDANAPIRGFKLFEQSERLLTWDQNNAIAIWDADGEQIAKWKAHDSNIEAIEVAPDEQSFCSTGSNGLIKVWDTDGQLVIDIDTKSPAPVLPRYSTDSKQIILPESGNRELSMIPLPNYIYADLSSIALESKATIKDLAHRHNIQFIDALVPSINTN